jgi:glutamate synthase domain-containing protein 3
MVNAPVVIDAAGLHYSELNRSLREALLAGQRHIEVRNVHGQRYIGTNLAGPVSVEVFGTPGNDLGAFMDGPTIVVHGNAQDGCGNTMNDGQIIVHGRAGDIAGLSARGGKIFIRDSVGYRVGIHMKEYEGKRPYLVVGGTAQDFLGEYMAGGVLVVLGLELQEGEPHRARFIGTGMHGGVIYLRGQVEEHQLGREIGVTDLNAEDRATLEELVGEFCRHFGRDEGEILAGRFVKLFPLYLRPYGRLYAY